MAMPSSDRARYSNKKSFNREKRNKGKDCQVDEDSPVIKAFRGFQTELDSRNDRLERIVKLSRDITIESKRLIFLLQRIAGNSEGQSILEEANTKISQLHREKFLPLALELREQDPFQYLKAFSPGLQEYIEAVTLYHYLASEKLVDVSVIQSSLTFPKESIGHKITADKQTKDRKEQKEDGVDDVPAVLKNQADDSVLNKSTTDVLVHVPQAEYMLGVADFTGELMRLAINSVGSGDLQTPKKVSDLMRVINTAFSSFTNSSRELNKKGYVLRQSLDKVENACYALQVRGSEIPKHMLPHLFSSTTSSDGPMPQDLPDECE